ncbi:hypothetical protein [Mesorhizobium sp. B2-3-5]|uniref:hypothetical protein n=1 Tax=Mesorhizobium sp. B2-3-5 TaxID=2589958 RepID=UPI001127472B|nr:hypothetical protein [Mesorhizobium sp. B2-3-5]TPM21641.1 hypothetical protein FJ958_26030 [Mesorhizobium sp. B2-3-5]
MKINKIATPPRGVLLQNPSGTSAFIPSGGKHETRLVEIGDFLQAFVEKTDAKFTPEHQQPENKQGVDMLHSRMRGLLRDLNDKQRDLNKRNATFTAPAALTDAPWESEWREHLSSLPLADRTAVVATGLSFAQSSALLRHSDLDRLGLDDRTAATVRENHRINAVVELLGLRANHASPSTLDNPLPGTVDEAAAFAEGKAAITALDGEQETLRNEAAALAGIVSIAAEVSGQDSRTLWTEIAA